MEDPNIIKTFLYIASTLIGLAITFFGIGKWAGKKNHESSEIKDLKDMIKEVDDKSKARMFTPDGKQILVRADIFKEFQDDTRAEIQDINKKQQAYDVTIFSIDSNVKMLVGLFEKFLDKE